MILIVGKYECKKYVCKVDSSHKKDIDWGYYTNPSANKLTCGVKCSIDANCETYEWSNTKGKETCKWWKKGSCHYDMNTKDTTDPYFVSCKEIGAITKFSFTAK